MTLYSCSMSLGEILFPIKFAAAFIWIYFSSLVNDKTNCGAQEYCFILSPQICSQGLCSSFEISRKIEEIPEY